MSRRSPSDTLAASLETALTRHFGKMADLTHKWVDWHSATFVGTRHELRFTLDESGAAALDTIDEENLSIRRGFVADLVVVERLSRADGFTVTLEVLTLLD
ncbi:MAG: hypothetical protein V4530_01520 [Pseudomonadota bacterium]